MTSDILLPLSYAEAESLVWVILKNNDPAFGDILRRLETTLQEYEEFNTEKEYENLRKWVSNDFTPIAREYFQTAEEFFQISNRCEVDEHPDGIHRHGLARFSKQAT